MCVCVCVCACVRVRVRARALVFVCVRVCMCIRYDSKLTMCSNISSIQIHSIESLQNLLLRIIAMYINIYRANF